MDKQSHFLLYFFLFLSLKLSASIEDDLEIDVISNDEITLQPELRKMCDVDGGYLIVSTIDGSIAALDPETGIQCWNTNVDSVGLISSSLNKLDMLDNGKQVRLVPSLDGDIFKFDKDKLEPLPVSAESLLKSSSKVGDNLSIIGGKDKNIIGVHLSSGKVCYKCTSQGCMQFQQALPKDVILIIEKYTQSVHAVDSQKGVDRWNFRVTELHVTIASSQVDNGFESTVKIAMHSGCVGVYDKASESFKWFQKLSSPIVDVWFVKRNLVYSVNSFEDKSQFFPVDLENGKSIASLFLGTFQNQLFIKQSKKLKSNDIAHALNSKEITQGSFSIATKATTTQIPHDNMQANSVMALQTLNSFSTHEFGLYFFVNYSVFQNSTHCIVNSSHVGHNDVVDPSEDLLWIINAAVTIILGFMCVIYLHFFIKVGPVTSPSEDALTLSVIDSEASLVKQLITTDFVSRFLQDFELKAILGRGGYGVVMEARNKIDDCAYAVKRIRFFDDKIGKTIFQKVMREVKALAVLDHPGIVRYFTSWIEVPPEGWQEKKDNELNIRDVTFNYQSSSSLPTKENSPASHLPAYHQEGIKRALFANPLRPFDDDFISNAVEPAKLTSNSSNSNSGTSSSRTNFTSEACETYGPTYLYIQMQLCRKESLREWLIKHTSRRNRATFINIFCQIVDAVDYVHHFGLMHRDLKPSNIFFSMDGDIKIGDFGLVTTSTDVVSGKNDNEGGGSTSSIRTKDIGTELYMSPEQRLRGRYDSKTDIFSLGIIFFEILVPFSTTMERDKTLTCVRKLIFPNKFIKDYPTEHRLINQLLQPNPQNRPSTSEIKTHHLFCEYFS